MGSQRKLSLRFAIGFLAVLFALPSFAASGGSSGGLFRRDFGVALSLGSSFFDETQSSNFYQHTGLAGGIEAGLRLGLRLEFISLGLTGNYGLHWFNDVRQGPLAAVDKYKHEVYQGLGGGFATFNLEGSKATSELIFEYYGLANHNIRYTDEHVENPYRRNGDSLDGSGWGLGFGGKRGDAWTWLLYRSITFNKQNIDSTATDLPSATRSSFHYQTLTFMFGQSF